jgi:DNA helicase-2/ATP-dependent DNA helicase PcrA
LLRLANTLSPADELRIPPRPHMHLLRLIDASASARQYYAKIVGQYILGGEEVEKTVWTRLTSELVSIARAAGGGREASQDTTLFSAWSDPPIREESVATGSTAALNVQRVEKEGRHVDLFVGSIHSVKGETHLSTLVVETYANAHFFKALLPWLTGTKRHGTASLNAAQRGRLFSAYVAMTRATHLLCLAIPAASLGTGKKASDAEQSLLDAGWSIVRV